MSGVLMKCGHAANGIDGNGAPICIICVGIVDGAREIDDAPPSLSGRKARCTYYGSTPKGRLHESNFGCKRGESCRCEVASDLPHLPFFGHDPDKPHDSFYCGCWGWD